MLLCTNSEFAVYVFLVVYGTFARLCKKKKNHREFLIENIKIKSYSSKIKVNELLKNKQDKMSTTRISALKAYRYALRSTRVAFQGDPEVLYASRNKIKSGFKENEKLNDTEKINEEIKKLNEVSSFLVKNIVQGEIDEEGRYMLKFHDKTELGDNETIKQNNKANLGSLAGAKIKKCSDRK